MRRLTATLFTSDLRLELDYVASEEKPAGEPSSVFGRPVVDEIIHLFRGLGPVSVSDDFVRALV